MVRAPVPEASVDEDSNVLASEDDVDVRSQPPNTQEMVLPETPPSTMELGPQRDLRLRTGPSIPPGDSRRSSGGRLRIRDPPPATEGHATPGTLTPGVERCRCPGCLAHRHSVLTGNMALVTVRAYEYYT